MGIFLKFNKFHDYKSDSEYEPFEKKNKCQHEKAFDWPMVKKNGDKYKVILIQYCKKCANFYNA